MRPLSLFRREKSEGATVKASLGYGGLASFCFVLFLNGFLYVPPLVLKKGENALSITHCPGGQWGLSVFILFYLSSDLELESNSPALAET